MKKRQINRIDKIRLMQQLLVFNGHDIAIDGDIGRQTQAALLTFKQSKQLISNDPLDISIIDKLFDHTRGYFFNNEKQPTVQIQSLLIKQLFPKANKSYVAAVFEEINQRAELYHLNTPLRQAHSLAQVRAEVGADFSVVENLNYRVANLSKYFRFYRNNPLLAERHGKSTLHPADQQAIASHAYANRMGNGGIKTEDGWNYRGRGIKGLTGRRMYRLFTQWHNHLFPDDPINFEQNPEKIEEPIYAARSGCFYWNDQQLYLIADRGATRNTVQAITNGINPGLPEKQKRRRVVHFHKIWALLK